MYRRIEEEVEPTVGIPRHRHFGGFFNVPVQAPTRDPPFYGYSEKPPHFSRLLRHAWEYGGYSLDLNPPGSPNVTINDISVIYYMTAHRCAGGLKKLDLRSGSQRHRHFVWFFNVPVQATTRRQPFSTASFRRLLRHVGDTEDTFSTPPPPPRDIKRAK